MSHHTSDIQEPYVASLLNLLQTIIEQNAQLQQQLQTEMNHHQICTHILTQIRTPLTVIRTSANIVQRYYERLTSEKRAEHLAQIDAQVAMISKLLDQLSQMNSHHCHANDK